MIVRMTVLFCVTLSACGPPSPEAMQRLCADRARAAAGPAGTVGFGIGSGGLATDLDVTISSDYIAGRDPQDVFDSCMARRLQAGARLSTEDR